MGDVLAIVMFGLFFALVAKAADWFGTW